MAPVIMWIIPVIGCLPSDFEPLAPASCVLPPLLLVLLYVLFQHAPSHMKFYLILELVAALCSVAVILMERAVFGLVYIGTMGDGIGPSQVVLICNGI